MSRPKVQPLPQSPSRLADHTTAFVRDDWYVAAMSGEVGRSLMARTLLGVGVLLYRKLDGMVAALRDRCPHRSFPLSRGVLDGDQITCGYHGLRFGADGACVKIPSQDNIPSVALTQAYPVVEKAPLVWIWMGDPERADPAAIPDHSWLSAPDYAHVRGYLHVKSSYVRLHENVLDLTHFPYLHGEGLGSAAYAAAPFTVEEVGDSVSITRTLAGDLVNPSYGGMIGNIGHRVNRTSESWFKTPGFHIAHATIEDLDGGVEGRTRFHFKIIHMFTPESATSTHYFWANARDVRIDDEAQSRAGAERAVATFREDVEALERIEELYANEGDGDFREISVAGDRAGLLMRRIIARRAASEGVR